MTTRLNCCLLKLLPPHSLPILQPLPLPAYWPWATLHLVPLKPFFFVEKAERFPWKSNRGAFCPRIHLHTWCQILQSNSWFAASDCHYRRAPVVHMLLSLSIWVSGTLKRWRLGICSPLPLNTLTLSISSNSFVAIWTPGIETLWAFWPRHIGLRCTLSWWLCLWTWLNSERSIIISNSGSWISDAWWACR